MNLNLKPAIAALGAITIGVGLAACGSSTSAGVVPAPGGGATVASVTTPSTTQTSTTSASTTPTTVRTPTSGALSKEPEVSVPTAKPSTKLVTKDLIVGTGATAEKGDEVWVNYVGKLYSNGKVFDSSWKDSPGQSFAGFVLGEGHVIPGWDQGLVGMKVGGRRMLIIPPSLAYGSAGSGAIPKDATLVFVVDLLKVTKASS